MLSFALKHAQAHKHHGRALKLLYKQLEDKATKENELKLIEVSTLYEGRSKSPYLSIDADLVRGCDPHSDCIQYP